MPTVPLPNKVIAVDPLGLMVILLALELYPVLISKLLFPAELKLKVAYWLLPTLDEYNLI